MNSLFSDALRAELKAIIREAIREELATANSNGHGSEFLTAEELAKVLKLNKATVYQWVKSKKIPVLEAKGTRRQRFDLAAVKKALES